MKKDIKAVFVIDGERVDEASEHLADALTKAFTEYFENNYSEWESVVEDFIKENDEI